MRMSDVLGQFSERTAVNARTLPGIFFGQYIIIRKGKIKLVYALQRQTINGTAQLSY